jgi:membrane protease YdiL (CAAX protease family)
MLRGTDGVLHRRPAVSYVLTTFAISWSAFGLWVVVPDTNPLLQTVALLGGGFGPMLAAIALLVARGQSVRRWARAVFRVRVWPLAYLVAVAVPIGAVLAAGAIHHYGLGGVLTPEAIPSPVEYPLFLAFIIVLGGGQEEPGWRGYLLPLLESRYTALGAAVLIGLVWAAWHLPLFVFPGSVQSNMAFWLYVPQVMGTSVVLTWLTNVSRGSVLPAMVLHGGANAVVNYYPVGGVPGATSVTGYGLLTTMVLVVAAVVVARTGVSLGRDRSGAAVDPSGTVVPAD